MRCFLWCRPSQHEIEWQRRFAYYRVSSSIISLARMFLAFALIASLAPRSMAQKSLTHALPSKPVAPHLNLPSGGIARAGNTRSSSRFRRSSPFGAFLSPFFDDFYNPDDTSSAAQPAAGEPPPFLLQAARALSGPGVSGGIPDNGREPPSSQPLMIELQGDRYVRVSSAAIDGEALPLTLPPDNVRPNNVHPDKGQTLKSAGGHSTKPLVLNSVAPAVTVAASSARDLPPVLLVFHDGHSEEVRDYTIADGFLYARGDYYSDGYWSKKIDLSAVDLPQTLQANSARSVKFVLPSAPNEVITRP